MSGARLHVPPGRAGRLWLDRRLGAARRGADLLDRKLRILQAKLAESGEAAALTGAAWRTAAAEADRLLLIATLLGGQRVIRLAEPTRYADVEVEFAVTMAVRHPVNGRCTPPPGPVAWVSATVEQARVAHEAALASAVRHAVAATAERAIEAEIRVTRYRLRAITERLVPDLEEARAQVVLAIDELERSDSTRLRRQAGQPAGPDHDRSATFRSSSQPCVSTAE